MRRAFVIFAIMFLGTLAFSQNFYTTDNIVLREISETEYRNAYEHREKNIYKWKSEGRKYDRVLSKFSSTDIAKKNHFPAGEWVGLCCLKPKFKYQKKTYLIREWTLVSSNAYYMVGEIPDTTIMFDRGDIDNGRIYYTCPDYDRDHHLHCRWYSFVGNKVNLIAEIEDRSLEYDMAEWAYDLPIMFADNRGHYYIVFIKNPNIYEDDGNKWFYEIQLLHKTNR